MPNACCVCEQDKCCCALKQNGKCKDGETEMNIDMALDTASCAASSAAEKAACCICNQKECCCSWKNGKCENHQTEVNLNVAIDAFAPSCAPSSAPSSAEALEE